MGLVSAAGFKSCFNFFLAWARTQRQPAILSLFAGLPVRSMYKFSTEGVDANKASFSRFMQIAENLGVILYHKCLGILRGLGNFEADFTALDGLEATGHFGAMVANFILRTLYKQETSRTTIRALVCIFYHPTFKSAIGPVLTDLRHIYVVAGCPEVIAESSLVGGCPIHVTYQNPGCFFCATKKMLNIFSGVG
ncbi:hypothetical protein AgCh_009641 [Apium graveolens]